MDERRTGAAGAGTERPGGLVRFAGWCYDRRRLVLLVWVIAIVGFSIAGQAAGGALLKTFDLPGSDAAKAFHILGQDFDRPGDTGPGRVEGRERCVADQSRGAGRRAARARRAGAATPRGRGGDTVRRQPRPPSASSPPPSPSPTPRSSSTSGPTTSTSTKPRTCGPSSRPRATTRCRSSSAGRCSSNRPCPPARQSASWPRS